jgi:hypothetical protein
VAVRISEERDRTVTWLSRTKEEKIRKEKDKTRRESVAEKMKAGLFELIYALHNKC